MLADCSMRLKKDEVFFLKLNKCLNLFLKKVLNAGLLLVVEYFHIVVLLLVPESL